MNKRGHVKKKKKKNGNGSVVAKILVRFLQNALVLSELKNTGLYC